MHVYLEQFGEIRHINYLNYNITDIRHAKIKLLGTTLDLKPDMVDVLMVASFIGLAQIYLRVEFLISKFNGVQDLHYLTSSYNQNKHSLVPYRTFKYSIYIRDSGTISRNSYIIGMLGKSYLLALVCLIILIFLVGAIRKRTKFMINDRSAAFLSIINTLVSNGDIVSNSRTISFRMIFLASSVLSITMWTALGAFLSAEQVMRSERKLFDSLRDLIELGAIQLCVDPNSMIYKYILETEDHSNLNTVLNGKYCPVGSPTTKDFVRELCQSRDRVAFVAGHNFATEFNLVGKWLNLENFPCKIVQVVENMYSFPRAMIYRPGLPFKKDFNKFFLRLFEVGIKDYIEAIATNRLKAYQQHQPHAEQWSDVRFPEVTLWMTRGLFQLLGAAIVLSWSILMTERLRLRGFFKQ